MGRFGITFSDEAGSGFKIESRKHYTTLMYEEEPGNGHFQRCLAWTSYIVLVFTALCAFNAPAAAHVMDSFAMPFNAATTTVGELVSETASRAADPWEIRGTR